MFALGFLLLHEPSSLIDKAKNLHTQADSFDSLCNEAYVMNFPVLFMFIHLEIAIFNEPPLCFITSSLVLDPRLRFVANIKLN